MFNCLCINDLFALQRYKNFWTFLLFSLCFKALSTIYMQVGNFSNISGTVKNSETLYTPDAKVAGKNYRGIVITADGKKMIKR